MKKYLMTGIAAIAICAAFTSCSKETNLYNEEVIKENTTQDIINNYNEAFIKTFGPVAEGHQWGFVDYSSKARTRDGSTYMNGNMEAYNDAPSLKENEEDEITAYVRQLGAIPQVAPTGLKDYFVKQVHDGEETYTNADGVGGILGSSKMNHLQIAMRQGGVINQDGSLSEVGDWIHINNFNKGDNTDWDGNTLVVDGGTFNFAYHGTEDNRYHDRWIAVKGSDVDAYYNALGTYSGAKYAGFYYICFDFEGKYAGGYTQIQGEWYNPDSPNDNKWGNNFNNINLPGDWTNADWSTCDLTIDWKYYDNNGVEQTITLHLNDPNQVRNIQTSNYVGGNMVIDGNNKYDDWIIRLVEAEPKEEIDEPDWDLRIICEDLNATATEEDPDDSDWDFNDLVLDVKFLEGDNVRMRVYAVGATLPIRINGESGLEAHGLYGQPTNMMINTGAAAAGYPSQAYETNGSYPAAAIFEREIEGVKANYGSNIKIEVEKGAGNWVELFAKPGQPASKMGVLPDFEPCAERQDIKGRYSNFVAWVAKQNPVYWWRPAASNE